MGFRSSVFPSIRCFFNASSVHIRWPKYWSFSFSISPFCEHSGLISLKIDWFDPLAIQGTLRSLSSPAPQFKGISSLAFCLLYSPPPTTICDHWEDYSLDYTDICQQSNVSAFQHSLGFFIAFLPRSCLLISWLPSPSTVILESKKRKSVTASTFSLSICHAIMGLDAMTWFSLAFSLKTALSFSSFTLVKRLFNSFSLSAIRVASSTYRRLLMFLPPILIPVCNASSLAFLLMCSAYQLNKQGDSRQPCHTPFSISNQSVVHTGF